MTRRSRSLEAETVVTSVVCLTVLVAMALGTAVGLSMARLVLR